MFIWFRERQLANCCLYGSEPASSINAGNFFSRKSPLRGVRVNALYLPCDVSQTQNLAHPSGKQVLKQPGHWCYVLVTRKVDHQHRDNGGDAHHV